MQTDAKYTFDGSVNAFSCGNRSGEIYYLVSVNQKNLAILSRGWWEKYASQRTMRWGAPRHVIIHPDVKMRYDRRTE
jgi:hypothetical protein